MAIQVEWGNAEQNLIYVRLDGDWNWYEFYARTGDISKMVGSVPHTVDIILEVPSSAAVHPDFMTHLQRARIFHLTLGTTVLVQTTKTNKPPLSSLFRPQTKVHNGGQPFTAYSLKEAHDLIASRRRLREKRSV